MWGVRMTTRFDLENQAIQVRVAEALEQVAESLEILAESHREEGIMVGFLSRDGEKETDWISDLKPFTDEEKKALKKDAEEIIRRRAAR